MSTLKAHNDGEFMCNGGAFFWVASHDSNGSWSDSVVGEVRLTAGCSVGGSPSPTYNPTNSKAPIGIYSPTISPTPSPSKLPSTKQTNKPTTSPSASPTNSPIKIATTTSTTTANTGATITTTTTTTSASSTTPNQNCSMHSNQCSATNPCPNGGCCSQWGYCGTSAPYCGYCCQSGNCWE
mmetsp:Transcript_18953/g.30637  ORF Transcript_18953/g.30637 Transcript_18953/m.30637 type:complete len:181 (-) Transcript_18953:283-825(-)